MSGRYVALEGIEGAGKSTVAAALGGYLQRRGVDVVAVREPGGTHAGERIRRVLLDPDGSVDAWSEALLFAAARAQLAVETVAPALAAGAWVVTDRSVYSSLAYQGGGRDLGIDKVRTVNEFALRGVWPELVVLLRVDPAIGFRREAVRDRIGHAGIDLQIRVSEAFDTLAAAEPDRFAVVDASQEIEAVVSEVCEIVEARWMTSTAT